jgi:hypothetical protein
VPVELIVSGFARRMLLSGCSVIKLFLVSTAFHSWKHFHRQFQTCLSGRNFGTVIYREVF